MIGQAPDRFQVVLDPQHGDARRSPVAEQALEHLDPCLIEGRHRLVEYQQLRSRNQPLGQQHPLAFAAGQRAHAALALVLHADPFKGLTNRRRVVFAQAEKGRATLAHGGHEVVDGHR
ncbi:hypothetical protein D3C80_1375030 [compost metagenome]